MENIVAHLSLTQHLPKPNEMMLLVSVLTLCMVRPSVPLEFLREDNLTTPAAVKKR